MVEKKASTVTKILILQAIVMLTTAAGFFIAGGVQMAKSPGVGGMVALLPNLYFAYRIKLSEGKDAKQIIRTFYAGEIRKILLTVVLFFIVFQIPGINLLTLLVGYIAVLSVHWFALILWRDI